MENSYDMIGFTRSEGVARLVLDRSPLNILNGQMMSEMIEAIESLPAIETKVLVLSGRGKAFSAGVEVEEHLGPKLEPMMTKFHRIFRALLQLDFPIVAMVQGACLGGGCELISVCDFVIASEEARFGQPEIKLGVFPPVAAVVLPHRIGDVAANDLILTGRVVTATEAREISLVSKVVPGDTLETETEKYVESLCSLSAPVLSITKNVVAQGWRGRVLEKLDGVEAVYLNNLMTLHDPHEGLRSFLEKRPPVWEHR